MWTNKKSPFLACILPNTSGAGGLQKGITETTESETFWSAKKRKLATDLEDITLTKQRVGNFAARVCGFQCFPKDTKYTPELKFLIRKLQSHETWQK